MCLSSFKRLGFFNGSKYTRRFKKITWTCIIVVGIIGLICTCLSIIVLLSCFNGCGPPVQSPGPFITYFKNREWRPSLSKTILLWTSRFNYPKWDLPEHFNFEGCEVRSCRVTTNRGELDESDAVLFHSRDLFRKSHDMPPQHPPHQVWVWHTLEPPSLVYLNMKHFAGVFNWTSSVRQDTDVFTPYGQLVRKNDSSVTWKTETDPNIRLCDSGYGTERQGCESEVNHYQVKTKLVASVASNCNSQSRRERLIMRIKKYLPVDTFGGCGEKKLKCSRQDQLCSSQLKTYRFYLSFENSLCKDYHSEKLWHPLIRNQIPIVYGGKGLPSLLPRNSYIDVADFPDIESLVSFIKTVNASEKLYNSFFWWQKYYKIYFEHKPFCELCKQLHDKSKPAQVYTDLDGFYRNDSCPQYSTTDEVAKFIEKILFFFNLIS